MYSIGEFSKLCGTSVKTLRYYSDIGLLKPSYVDPSTNYRYYGREKIQVINKINILKSCDMSLTAIKELIENGNLSKRKTLLKSKMIELEDLKKHIARRIQEMDKLKQQMELKRTPKVRHN